MWNVSLCSFFIHFVVSNVSNHTSIINRTNVSVYHSYIRLSYWIYYIYYRHHPYHCPRGCVVIATIVAVVATVAVSKFLSYFCFETSVAAMVQLKIIYLLGINWLICIQRWVLWSMFYMVCANVLSRKYCAYSCQLM